MPELKEYKAVSNHKIVLDISNEAFDNFGFDGEKYAKIRHGDKIIDGGCYTSIALGFASYDVSNTSEKRALWVRMDTDRKNHYYVSPSDLKQLKLA